MVISLPQPGYGIENLFTNEIIKDEKKRLNMFDTFVFQSKQLISMVTLTHNLANKFPELNFIYRPHPSEDHDYYKVVFKGVKI